MDYPVANRCDDVVITPPARTAVVRQAVKLVLHASERRDRNLSILLASIPKGVRERGDGLLAAVGLLGIRCMYLWYYKASVINESFASD